jgi:hypothetical protein
MAVPVYLVVTRFRPDELAAHAAEGPFLVLVADAKHFHATHAPLLPSIPWRTLEAAEYVRITAAAGFETLGDFPSVVRYFEAAISSRADRRASTESPEPIVTFSDNFKTVNCTTWMRSESRKRGREQPRIWRRLFENWHVGNKYMGVSELLSGSTHSRLDKALDSQTYPQSFELLDRLPDNRAGNHKVRLKPEFKYIAR